MTALLGSVGILATFAQASPAQAGAETSTDVTTIRTCLAGQRNRREKATCIGQIATSCLRENSKEPVSIQTVLCTGQELAAWDVILNENYAAQQRSIERTDEPDSLIRRDQMEALRTAQRLWIQFRDAEMERERANSHGANSVWITANVEKIGLEMTARRAIDLD